MTTSAVHRLLRALALVAGLSGTLFWLGCIVWWWLLPTAKRDGLELMGVIMATLYFLIMPLPALLLGWRGRGLVVAALLGVAAIAIASDVLLPWIPWGLFPR